MSSALSIGVRKTKKGRVSERRWQALLASPAVLLYVVFLIFPIVIALSGAFPITSESVAIANTFLPTLWRTLEISAVTTAICAVGGFYLAIRMWKARPRTRLVLMLCVLFPFWSSLVIRAFGWHILLQRGGPITELLASINLVSADTSLSSTRVGLYLGLIQIFLPFVVLPAFATLTKIAPAVHESAAICGARPIRQTLTITLPLAMPGIAVGAIMVFGQSMGSFVIPELLGGLGDSMYAQMIAVQTTQTLNWPVVGLMALILIVASMPAIILFSVFGRRWRIV